MAWLIHASGATETVEMPDEGSLEFMQEAVNGYIEVIPCEITKSDTVYVYCIVNEEGIPRDLDPNMVASRMLERPILGSALFLEASEMD